MAGALLAILIAAGALVAVTGLRVEFLGPVIVYGVALVAVVALTLAPAGEAD